MRVTNTQVHWAIMSLAAPAGQAHTPGPWEQAAQAEAADALPPARTGSPPGQRSQPGDPLTRQQHHVLTYLHHFLRVNHQLPPTKCIARAFGWHSNNAAAGHIERLAAKGYIEKNECGGWRFTAAGMALAPALPSKARTDIKPCPFCGDTNSVAMTKARRYRYITQVQP